jgi:hypothetical protein
MAVVISLAVGLISLKADGTSRRVPEPMAIEPADSLKLMSQTDNDRCKGIRPNHNVKLAFFTDTFVEMSQQLIRR